MHITKRSTWLALPLVAAGLGVGAAPAMAAVSAHARPLAVRHAAKTEAVRLTIKDVSTPGGVQGAFIGPNGGHAATLFTAHVGEPVVLTIVNQSKDLHNLVASGLGVNKVIPIGATVKVQFTPKKTGSFHWYCPIPCGGWVMSHMGYMEGSIKVVTA